MLGKRRMGWVMRLLLTDSLALGLAFVAAYWMRYLLNAPIGRPVGPAAHYLWLLAVIVPVWLGALALLGGYSVRWVARSRSRLAAGAAGLGLVLLTALLFLLKGSEINRSLVLLFAGTSALALAAEREGLRRWLARRGQRDRWARVALVVGTDVRAARVIAALGRYPEVGWRVRGCLRLSPAEPDLSVHGIPVLGGLEDLADLLHREGPVDEVFFAVAPSETERLTEALEVCESLGIDARVLVDLYRPAHARPFVEELFRLPFYGFSLSLTRQWALAAKRAVDFTAALLLVLLTSPALLAIALLIKASSRGPVIFRQERVGFHGRRFTMYKFRSMVVDAERQRGAVAHLNEMSGPVFKARRDPRVTPIGRLLRRFSLDELPQLLNVLTGEMSLVGPRPLPVYEANRSKGAQRRRLAMRPGITGLWQVSGRNTLDFDEWIRLDLLYVDRWSFGLDVRILLRTAPAVLGGRGAR